jgi:CheY-like chemotaxis protein
VRRRAFDPFFTTKGVGEGSGLGLSQVFGFAAQSGGFAAIYSELGLGAAVRVYLPVADADARPAPPPPPQGRGRDGSASAHVLVVEDDAFVRAYAAACLAELGHRSTLAENAPQALAILRQGAEVDVMFTDVVMPGGLDGFELAARARSIRPDLKVLLTSGYPFESLARAGRSPGRDRVLTKPYRRDVLAARLSELLAGP